MPLAQTAVLFAAGSYLVGAIPFAFIIGKLYGVDIRKTGSGNVGATNVLRSVGKKAGITALILDIAKGFIPAFFIPGLAAGCASDPSAEQLLRIICGIAAICGHVWPVYLGFRGGKGIATSAGALIAIAPEAVLIGFIVWLITFSIFKYVSLASIAAALAIPCIAWYIYSDAGTLLPWTLTAIGLLAVLRHRTNIQRLARGTESKISLKKKD